MNSKENEFDKTNNEAGDKKSMDLYVAKSCKMTNKNVSQRSPTTGHKSINTPCTPPGTPDLSSRFIDDDLESLQSYGSSSSLMSCDHNMFPKNGTTYSERKKGYVLYRSQYASQSGLDYLTPTQRAQKHLKKLRMMLAQAKLDLERKDSELVRLTNEVIELRLFKASLSSPEDHSNSSEAITVKENPTNDFANSSNDASPIVDMVVREGDSTDTPSHIHAMKNVYKAGSSEMYSSFADSGHFDDITSSVLSRDMCTTKDQATLVDCYIDEDRQALIEMYERKIEELIKITDIDKQEQTSKYNDRIEALLEKLSACNTKYSSIVPDYEQAKLKVYELESELEILQKKLDEQEDKINKMYLHMFTENQEIFEHQLKKKANEFVNQSKVSLPQLVQQLNVTQNELQTLKDTSFGVEPDNASSLLSAKEAISLWLLGAKKEMYSRLVEAQQNKVKIDPAVKLQFLKSAVYYFLTTLDKEASQAHLNVIESLLEFSDAEKERINKVRSTIQIEKNKS